MIYLERGTVCKCVETNVLEVVETRHRKQTCCDGSTVDVDALYVV